MNFQQKVDIWMMKCFGQAITEDKIERNHRLLEEALEVVQATGFTREQSHKMVDYVFDRPSGEIKQEIGGLEVCIAALCNIYKIDAEAAAETELNRCWEKSDKIREKQKLKPRF